MQASASVLLEQTFHLFCMILITVSFDLKLFCLSEVTRAN